ncbi:unnamed protein product [Pylaiella littoralis]
MQSAMFGNNLSDIPSDIIRAVTARVGVDCLAIMRRPLHTAAAANRATTLAQAESFVVNTQLLNTSSRICAWTEFFPEKRKKIRPCRRNLNITPRVFRAMNKLT